MDDTDRELEPVVDHLGFTVWRIRVAPGERTCLACGETFTEGDRCPICCTDEQGNARKVQPPSVPTISYLREGEWER